MGRANARPIPIYGGVVKKELYAALNRTLWGKRFISVENGNGRQLTLIAKDLELKDKIWIDFIYEQALAKGKEDNLISQSELANFLSEGGVWTKNDELEISNLKKTIIKIEEKLKEDITKRERILSLKVKTATEKALADKQYKKAEYYSNSLETFADTQRIHATLVCSLYRDENIRYWPTWEDFQNETDVVLINNATTAVFSRPELTIKMIRQIARAPEWRFKWAAYKASGDLFGKPLKDLTNDQESLVYWSQVYDAAYESYERPADFIIENDDKLDKWFEEQSSKRKQEDLKNSSKKNNKIGSENIWRHGEVGIVVNEALESDLKRAAKLGQGSKDIKILDVGEINELNDPLAKKFVRHQNEKIKKHGVIGERDLRSDSNSRRVIGSKDAVFKKAKRPDGFTGKQIIDEKPGGTLKGRRE